MQQEARLGIAQDARISLRCPVKKAISPAGIADSDGACPGNMT